MEKIDAWFFSEAKKRGSKCKLGVRGNLVCLEMAFHFTFYLAKTSIPS